MKSYIVLVIQAVVLITGNAFAQNVGIGTTTPHSSAILDVQSTNKGVSFPSMTTAQRKAMQSPKPGLLVYDIDKNTIYMYDGGQWLALLFTVSESFIPPITRTASDGQVGDQFGFSVAMSGSYAVIGAPSDNVGTNTNQGCVYIFVRTASVWTEQAKLTASDGAPGDFFGCSVSISNNYVIVGSYLDNSPVSDAGSAYIFMRTGTTWTEQARLVASNATAGDHFGYSVSINSSYAIIGAKDDDVGADVDEGSVYVFLRSGSSWTQQDNMIAPFGAAGDHFGYSVGISGDYVVVGANDDDVGGITNAGSAHVFLRNGANWDYQDQLLTEGDAYEDDHFGESVAIDGDYVVVGQPYNPAYPGDRAFIFIRAGISWAWQATLFANLNDLSVPVNQFGFSVSIEGEYVLVGANYTTTGDVIRKGAAYLFKRDGTDWIVVRKIEDGAGAFHDYMGSAVAVSGFNCIVATPFADAQKGKVLLLNFQ